MIRHPTELRAANVIRAACGAVAFGMLGSRTQSATHISSTEIVNARVTRIQSNYERRDSN